MTSMVVANRAFVGSMPGPKMRSSNRGGMIVCNTEELTTVTSSATSGNFVSGTSFLIPSLVPWLNGIASSFSKFRWTRVRLFCLPAVGTGVSGRLAFSLLYDTNDNSPSNMRQIISGNRATFGPVWAGQSGFDSTNPFANHSDMVHLDLDCSKLGNRFYPYATQTSFQAMSATDKNIYSPAQVIVANEGVTAVSSVIGSIYISYEVELLEPVATGING